MNAEDLPYTTSLTREAPDANDEVASAQLLRSDDADDERDW